MTPRALGLDDIKRLKEIHEKHYSHEFSFPDFLNGFYCAFVIEDESGIVAAGGVRPICESIIITDKDRSVRDRRYALSQVLQASMFIANAEKYNELHAFIQDTNWEWHLSKVGFKPTKGKSLVLNW